MLSFAKRPPLANMRILELLTPHTALYQGQYSSVLDFDTNSLSPSNRTAAQILNYRAQIALCQSSTVLSSLSASAASSPDLASVRALALYTSGNVTEALSAVESLVDKEGENGTLQVLCGTVLALAERYEDALSLLSKHQGSLEALVTSPSLSLFAQQARFLLIPKPSNPPRSPATPSWTQTHGQSKIPTASSSLPKSTSPPTVSTSPSAKSPPPRNGRRTISSSISPKRGLDCARYHLLLSP